MNSYLKDLSGKKVLITGASSGIGRACSLFLAELGCEVIALARREERLKELVEINPSIKYEVGDITDLNFLSSLDAKNLFDVDILINNAGLALDKINFEKSKDEDNEKVFATNLNAVFQITRRSLKKMLNNKEGDIVNICSISSHEAYCGGAVYCASKHALLAFGKALREETYGDNIRVISISPGLVNTEFSEVRFRGDKKKADEVYKGYKALDANDIAFQVVNALRCPRHVNLDEVIVLASDQAGATRINKRV